MSGPTQFADAKPRTLQELFKGLGRLGDAAFLISFGRQTVSQRSYAELDEETRKFAGGLQAAGIAAGDRVVVCAPVTPASIAAAFGVLRAGRVIVPVDTQLGESELRHVLRDSGARVVVTTEAHWDMIKKFGLEVSAVLLDAPDNDAQSYRKFLRDDAMALPTSAGTDTAALFYTSGTTGPPKGVPLTHDNLVFQLESLIEAHLIEPGSRVLMPLPLHHVYPFVIGLLAPVALGLTIILPHLLTGPELVRAIHDGKATVLIGVPRLYEALLAGIQEQVASRGRIVAAAFGAVLGVSGGIRRTTGVRAGRWLLYPLHRRIGRSLRFAACGGAALDAGLARKLEALGWMVSTGYGLTETSPMLTLNAPPRARIGSVGAPVPGVEVRVVSGEDPGLDRAQGQEGEIIVRGPGVFAGYHNLPMETAKAFTRDGWFRTADLGYIDRRGDLHITGRTSTVLVLQGGEKVQPDWLESVYGAHPYIAETGVLLHEGRLAAIVVPALGAIKKAGETNIEHAVAAAMMEQGRRVPSYGRVGSFVISRDSLARTRLGKIQRHVLARRYDELFSSSVGTSNHVGPIAIEDMSTQDRELLEVETARRVWEWLGERYPQHRLTPDTHAGLELGIDSLEWVNLTLTIRGKFNVELAQEALTRIETVRDLILNVVEAERSLGAPAEALPSLLERPDDVLSEGQKRWLRPLGVIPRIVAGALFRLNRFLVHVLFRLTVEGRENLPIEGAFVITPNHTSYLDPFVVSAALDNRVLRRVHWAGWTGVAFRNPVMRFFSRLAQAVPVEPERAALSSLAFGVSILRRGEILVWFPEGGRSKSGKLEPFKPGIGILLAAQPVLVIPVYIHGAFEALPPGGGMVRFRKITLVFGKRNDAHDLLETEDSEMRHERIARELERSVNQLGEEFRRKRQLP